jgi:hypothetical protein
MKELSERQKDIVRQAATFMQLASRNLHDVDERQKFVGSESERLFNLSLELLNRYGLMPNQQAMRTENEDESEDTE